MKLDTTDVAILKALQKDSNRTVKSLAEDLKRSTTPVFERIKKLCRPLQSTQAFHIVRLNTPSVLRLRQA